MEAGFSAAGVRCFACPLRIKSAFKEKSAEEIAYIDSMKIDHRRIAAGDEIIHAGQEDAELFTIFSGWAFRHKTLSDGRRQILNFLFPGDLAGLQASLLDIADHAIEALTDVEVCVFSRRKTWGIFQNVPDLAYNLTWLGAREERILDEMITSIGQRSASERMAALMIMFYRRAKHLDLANNNTFDFPLTRQHLADTLGLSLVHTIKTWSRLKQARFFSFDKGKITILNPHMSEDLTHLLESEWKKRPIL